MDALVAALGDVLGSVDAGLSHSLSAVKHAADHQLPRSAVRLWEKDVHDHLSGHPFTEEELERLRQSDGPSAVAAVETNPALAYGSTVLGALLTPDYALYVQLGDGDILVVSDEGEVRRPIAADSRLIANETTSLCSPRAWDDFRIGFEVFAGRWNVHPALVLLSTDGCANSYHNDENFRKIGPDLLQMIRDDGLAHVTESLEPWLHEVSDKGSGDDVTIALAYRVPTEAVPTAPTICPSDKGQRLASSADERVGSELETASGQEPDGNADTSLGAEREC